jgi:hypothetical protein
VITLPEAGKKPSIFCGTGQPECTSPSFCCATAEGTGTPPPIAYACDSNTNQCTGPEGPGAVIRCAVTTDCPTGEVCCGADLNGVYSEVACTANACTGTTGTGATEIQFCDPNANDCPVLTPLCQASSVLTGFSVCRM